MAEYVARLSGGSPPMKVESVFHREDRQLLRAMERAGDGALVLDERGALLSSEELSALVYSRLEACGSRLTFAIGGADGLPPELRGLPPARLGASQPRQELLSLGRLTLPHRLVRVVLVEQLYRAQEIRSGSAYHRGEPS